MRSQHFNIKQAIIFSVLSFGLLQPASAASLNLQDAPLIVSTSSDPNIMFVLDDSGSMNNIIWDAAYNPAVTYTDWSSNDWSATSGNVRLSTVNQGGCNNGFKEGNNGGNDRCLRLPDPLGGGNTRYSGNYLNYLFDTYGVNNSNVDIIGTIPGDFRMNVARDVSTNVINSSTNMNFCLQSFNFQQAGNIDVACTPTQATVTTAINALVANSWTPLAETYYEVTRYFRGMDAYTSPITDRCQKNYAIVVTDGYPTFDSNFPNNDPDDPTSLLPDWDSLSPATTVADFNTNTIPPYSDGFQPANTQSSEGFSLFLDDIAKFAFDIDLRKAPDVDSAGVSFDAADFPKQNLVTFTVGFALNNRMLQDAAFYGDGQYFQANDSAGLTTALSGALSNIQARNSAAAAVAANSGFLSSDTGIYLGRFNTGTFTGQFLHFKLDPFTGQLDTTGSAVDGAQWEVSTKIPVYPASRNIFSYNGSQGVDFVWTAPASASATTLSAAQLNSFDITAGGTASDDQKQSVFNYIRGDTTCETSSGKVCKDSGGTDMIRLRDRANLLGTIVNSQAIYVGAPGNFYPDTWGAGSAPEDCVTCKYSDFVKLTANKNRTKMVYFGANDGMLHAVVADTSALTGGVEKFTYIPSSVISNLNDFAKTSFAHKFYVDGSPNVIDAFVGGKWRSVLVGGLNKGGQGVYILDVTDPTKFGNVADVVMSEFSDADDADLGYTFARPAIIRMQNNKWAAVFGNGYNNTEADGNASTTGLASLYIVFLDGPSGGTWTSGTDYIKISTTAGTATTPNGIASVTPIDIDGDRIVDYIYGGDLLGNMWKFNVNDVNTAKWDIDTKGSGNKSVPLFTVPSETVASVEYFRAITTRPIISNPGGGGFQLHFGTGRYLDKTDTDSTNAKIKERFYSLLDPNDGKAITPTFLVQTVNEDTVTFNDGTNSNTVTVRYGTTLGTNKAINWYLDLPDTGERQVTTAVKRGDNIIFVTNVPSSVKCDFGGYSWLMELDARDGSEPQTSVFDLTGDGKIDNYDTADDDGDPKTPSKNPAGVRYSGKLSAPTILAGQQTDKKLMTTSAGSVQVVTEKSPAGGNRRHSWRQIR